MFGRPWYRTCSVALVCVGQPFGVVFAQFGMSSGCVENQGQWPDPVQFRTELPGAFLWFEPGAVLIHQYDGKAVAHGHGLSQPPADLPDRIDHHAVRLRFPNAGDPHCIGESQLPGRFNFFIGNDPSKWGRNARAYASVRMTDIAPGCDAVFRERGWGLKYDLVVEAGADPAGLVLEYEGAHGISVREGNLVVRTALGGFEERIPLAYQDIQGTRHPVECRFDLKGDRVGFKLGRYDPEHPLIIDPVLSFSTFSGSVSNNFGYTASFDEKGFLYSGSTAFGASYPVTTGAYQTDWGAGTTDMAITKYDTTGSFLVWSTYLGGGAAEMPHSLIVSDADELFVLGTTGSTDFPMTLTPYDGVFNGGQPFTPDGLGVAFANGCDMVVGHLSADGSDLLGATYLGGDLNDGLNSAPGLKYNYADEVRGEVLLDEAGDVWIVSCTQSPGMFVTPDAAQSSFGGGTHDGFVAKLDPSLSTLLYASYFGGDQADAAYSGAFNDLGELVITGGTTSTDLPVHGGAVSPNFNGGLADAFVARFSSDASSVEACTYWGSNAYDQAYFVELDGPGDVYLFGQTEAPSGLLVQNVQYAIPAGGQFISKMDPDLSTVLLSSRTGSGDGDPDISPTAFLVDFCDKIYTSGWGSDLLGGPLTVAGLPVTIDAYQGTTTGHDFYLAVFEVDMDSLVYATYFGGSISNEHVDGGTSRFDRRGRVYQSVCAGCQGNSDFPTTPDAWSATNNSGLCNNGVFKFDFEAPLVVASFDAPDTVCANEPVEFTNLSSGASGFLWDLGDMNSTTVTSPTHTYGQPGQYIVTLTASDPNACNLQDIAVGTVVVTAAGPSLEPLNDTLLCGPLDSFSYTANSFGSGTSFHWSSMSDLSDMLNSGPTDSTLTLDPVVPGTYFLSVGNGSECPALDSVHISTSLMDLALDGDSLICADEPAQLNLTGVDPGSIIGWEPSDEILSGQGTPQA
ncbi:MAG: PKD domain-containing protein, partial [Flavobacteriales bacterium]|nr:PKD domain-containing protein [Flavobacteriales bacterium]